MVVYRLNFSFGPDVFYRASYMGCCRAGSIGIQFPRERIELGGDVSLPGCLVENPIKATVQAPAER